MEAASKIEKFKINVSSKQPTALVAGGAGFLGSHLCESLLSQQFNVIALDNLSVSGSKKNIERLLSSPNFSFWEEDINKPDFKLSPTIPLTHIFHLASIEEHLSSDKLSLQTLLVNSLGTKNLLDLAVERGVKFILVSSTEVFHGALSQTSVDNYFGKAADPEQVSFSEAKRFAETLTAEYFRSHDAQTTIIRVKDPYGPRMSLDVGSPLGQMIEQALNKERIELTGDGLQTYNPTFVTDIIFGIVKASVGNFNGKIFNVINPEKYTERAIAETLQKIIGGVEIVFKKKGDLQLSSYPLIINPTQEQLGWEPKVSLRQGLEETISNLKGETFAREAEIAQTKGKRDVGQPKKQFKTNSSLVRRIIIITLAVLLFWILLLPPAVLFTNIYSGARNIQNAEKSLKGDNFESAVDQAKKAENAFNGGQNSSKSIFWAPFLPALSDSLKQTGNLLFYAENISAATKNLGEGLNIIEESEEKQLSEEKLSEKLLKAGLKIDQAARNLEIATSVEIEEGKLLPTTSGLLADLKENEAELTELINALKQSLPN
ncbi:MAG: hypothetical protein A2Z11_03925 [Candidatus Woykebacteria bacterium RBG_16_43_9]|uniref:NAD-dependent epimerase/dehydratase domain-containing protein n=1 Tax=Candidatus Woykebacteria bacterium RBG_16_43_9 TaxID=1802596 RepID=A0A1G1WCX8_9BACT|nr:MAG: hypothetical protein A2Z11_03925 [Candidatus Woykebacteria bacterium RBG_16_43_9]